MLGALRSGGVQTLVIATVPVGFGFGTIEIMLPAFAREHGAPELAGVLLATWALASATGGLLYGARHWGSLHRTYLCLACLLPLGFLPPLAAPSIALMAAAHPARRARHRAADRRRQPARRPGRAARARSRRPTPGRSPR